MTVLKCIARAALVLACFSSSAYAVSVIHWINNTNQNAGTVLGSGAAFTTSFRTAGDVTATRVSGTLGGLFTDNLGGPTPGNNPAYLTNFVGSSTAGTGNGNAGVMGFLDLGGAATSSLQLDFAEPLTSDDRILLVDADSSEQYRIEAFSLSGSSYVPLSLAGWTYETFSGAMGVLPDSRWPTWNAANGLLAAGSSGLNEELSVLTPNQPVSRLVVSKLAGAGFSTGIQIIEITGVAGDYNQNGAVDAADYIMWCKNRNSTNVLPNDPLGGTISTPQFNQWRSRFAQIGGSSIAAGQTATVPEPSIMHIAILASLAAAASSRRRRK